MINLYSLIYKWSEIHMNFIIYEDEKKYSTKYKNVIHKLLGQTTLNYEIIEIN